ncbi:MAG: MMPL family transporter [Legionellaceae bacterium]|nr:MMPL family transporter [Legionellaceae bacterium]
MKKNIFSKVGRLVYRFRVAIIFIWTISAIACIPFIPHIMAPFQSTGFVADKADSTRAQAFLDKHLGYDQNDRFLVVYHSKTLKATSRTFNKKIKWSLAKLKNFPIRHTIIYPNGNPQQISKDKHAAYAVIFIKNKTNLDHEQLEDFKQLIRKPKNMSMEIGGKQVFIQGLNKHTQEDLYRADAIAAPITSIVLILIFGTIVATLIPVSLGGGCALIILTTLYFLGHLFTLSIFTLNLALLLGLCLSLDYALFIIFRFRSELKKHRINDAIAITFSTAGRAIFFSGIAVFISLSALVFFPINILFSIGVGGLIAVFVAVMVALTLLPATLSVLGHRINHWAVRDVNKKNIDRKHLWKKIAQIVTGRPWFFFLLSLSFLLLLGYSVCHVRFGISDFRIVPKQSESRMFIDEFKQHFNKKELVPILLIVSTDRGSILSSANISRLYRFTRRLEKNDKIERVDSIVTTSPRLSKQQYQKLYQTAKKHQPKNVKQLLETSTGKKFSVIRIFSKYGINDPETKALVKELRDIKPGRGMSVQLTGAPVQNIDVMETIKQYFPYAALWVISLTYLSLLVLLRSLFLPLKAIFMNILSLSACYGVLVFIFQEGHLHQLLNFEPQGMLDITLAVIIFCAIFGFSMDYEVFLLTRIQEHFQKTRNNTASIIFGIDQSSRIITSAALIVICICGSFMTADVIMVKEFGLGIAVAIAVDAFAIRTILVPSTMVLLKRWNWYIPKWLDKLLPQTGL